jgi:formylglycine-generating enzyme required for sulfatase activity
VRGRQDREPRRALGRGELPWVVRVPGGPFRMGSDRIDEAEAPNPPHLVELSPHWLGVYPVTNADYDAFARATGAAAPASFGDARFGAANQPVVGVSWQEASAYCAWAGGALPTEAQWELSARGFDGRRYPWGDDEPSEALACFAQDWNLGHPAPVDAHPAGVGPFGSYDLAGNVWEWCRDTWQPDAHLARPSLGRDPCVPGTARIRPLRGGCWRSIDCKLQGAYRNWSHEAARHVTIGFRLCLPDATPR